MKKQPVLWYFVLTFAFTYGVSFLAGLDQFPAGLRTLFVLLTLAGPTVGALTVVHATGGWTEIKQLLKRILIWRVGIRWYLFVFLFPVTARLLSVGVSVLFGGEIPQFFHSETVNLPGINPQFLLIVLFVINFIRPSLVEEIGWRGFALPELQQRFGATGASLILGFLWGLWHFHPVNIPSYQGWMLWFLLMTVCSSVIFTWIYNHTNGSILLATFFHASNNVSEFIVPIAPVNTGVGITLEFIVLRVVYLLFAIALITMSLKKLSI